MKDFFSAVGLVLAAMICVILMLAGGVLMKGCSFATGWANKAVDVAAAQVDPAALLKKYEWFKDASAQLDKRIADINVYDRRVKALEASYEGQSRNQWNREDRSQYNIWMSELSGIQAAYNMLAAQYNAQMAKINYAFCNVGDLPRGATQPLPRDYKPYQ